MAASLKFFSTLMAYTPWKMGYGTLDQGTGSNLTTNVQTPNIDRPYTWAAGSDDGLDLDVGVGSADIYALALTGCNFANFTLYNDWSSDPGGTIGGLGGGVLRGGPLGEQRYRGSLAGFSGGPLSSGFSRLRIQVDAGTPRTDGSFIYRIGAVYVFGAAFLPTAQARTPIQVAHPRPKVVDRLDNGQRVASLTGAPFAEIALDMIPTAADDVEKIARLAEAGICWLDLGNPSRRELQWPVRFFGDGTTRVVNPAAAKDRVSLTLSEVA